MPYSFSTLRCPFCVCSGCCSVLQLVCVQGVAVCCSFSTLRCPLSLNTCLCCNVLKCVTVVLQCGAVCCSVVWGDSRCVALWGVSVELWIHAFSCPLLTAQDARNHTLAVHELVDFRFVVLAGSESTITEIIGYKYSSLSKPCRGFSSDTNQFVDRCL